MRFFTFFLVISFILCLENALAIDRFVNAATGIDTGDCSAGNCQTITYAIAQANAGDVIIVAAGTYPEALNINKSLAFRGAFVGVAGSDGTRGTGESIIQNPATDLENGILVQITANNVILDGFTLNGQSNYVQGIAMNAVQNITVQNNRIINFNTSNDDPNTQLNVAGIWAEGNATGNIIQNNLIQNISNPTINYSTGFSAAAPNPDDFMLGIGLLLRNGFYADVLNNQIENVVIGIRVQNFTVVGQSVSISNNEIDAHLQGLRLSTIGVNASPFTIQNNTFDFSTQGYNILLTIPFSVTQNIDLPNSALNFTQLNRAVNVSNNDIIGAFYGYFLFGINPAIGFLIDGGTIEQVAQGIACVNYDGSSIYAPSQIRVEDITMDNFQGQAVGSNNILVNAIKDAYDFHAGVYLLISSGTPNNTPTLVAEIENCTINGTARVEKTNSAGIYAANFSTRRLVTLNVNNCEISENENRGVHLQLVSSASFTNCDLLNNGTGGNSAFRFGVVLRSNTTQVNFDNCRIESSNARFCITGEPGAQVSAFNCTILGGTAGRVNFDPTQLNQNFSGCWWGSNVLPTLGNFIDRNPWLNVGTDTDPATRGFQGDFSYLNVNTAGFQFAPLERLQEAHDLLIAGGTIHLRTTNFNETLTLSKNCNLANESTANISNLSLDGVGILVNLLNPFTISNTLILTNGTIVNNATSILHLTNNATNALQPATLSGTSWVNGYLRRNQLTGSFYDFPVGTAAAMQLTQVRLNAQTGTTDVLARFNPNNPLTDPIASTFTPFTENGFDYDFLNTTGYWEIEPNATGTSSDYDLLMFPTFLSPIQNGAIVKRSGSPDWLPDGTANLIIPGIERNGLNGFSNFAIATDDVPLANNSAILQVQTQRTGLLLLWQLPSLRDIQNLLLERSTDLRSGEVIHQADLNTNQQHYQFLDELPALDPNQIYYYRLKIRYYSGQVSYSSWEAGKIEGEARIIKTIYPNPSQGILLLQLFEASPCLMEVLDTQGKIHYKQQLVDEKTSLDLRYLPRGTYFLKIGRLGKYEWRKIILE